MIFNRVDDILVEADGNCSSWDRYLLIGSFGGLPVDSPPGTATVTAFTDPGLSVTKTASPSTYDAVGDFAYRVGLPGKSGVGGGILALVPGELALAAWSPGLDDSGGSYVGTLALETFVRETGLGVF